MAKSDSNKRAEMMEKEWMKSKSTTKSINKLIEKGTCITKNSVARGRRLEKASRIQKLVRLLFSKTSLRGVSGFQFISFFRVFSSTMRLGFAICIPTPSFLLPLLFIRVSRVSVRGILTDAQNEITLTQIEALNSMF